MNYKEKSFKLSILILFLLCTCTILHAQCNCSYEEYINSCEEEKIITGGVNGSNITLELHDAVMNYCKIRLANYSGDDVTYFTFPQVFRDINHKEIVLDAGVTLVGLPGASTQCSQSVLTFDGNNVHDILIRGDYCDGEKKPSIEMGEPSYIQYSEVGYLVGADDVGDPYLNDQGEPNYVFSDGDNDPYFDNNGIPNFITNSSQSPGEKDCSYNDFLCNRKIVVWCPYTWEARNIISLHGVSNFWIEDLTIANGTGGDGIHITDDQDFNVSNQIQLDNIDYISNTRNALKITNAYCVDLKNQDFINNGVNAPIYLITPEAGLNLDQNSSPGSVDDYMGTLPNYALHNITLEKGYFSSNSLNDISIDIPLGLTLCNEEVGFKATNVCISESVDAIAFGNSNVVQDGVIKFSAVSINEFSSALKVSEDWLSEVIDLGFTDMSIENSNTTSNAFDINSSAFCTTATISDICKSTTIVDNLCQAVNCATSEYACAPNTDPKCDPKDPEECDLNVYTEVEKSFEYDCDCDYLFMVDESGSVENDDWDEMHCSITDLMAEIDAICEDSCGSRFSVIQWSDTDLQHLNSDFSCTPVDFGRWFHNDGTNVGDAINFLKDLMDGGEGFQPNEECFKVVIFTDVGCYNFEDTDAGYFADQVKMCLPNVEFFIVDYSSDDLVDCETALDVVDDADGNANPNDVIPSEFDCETGLGVDEITDTLFTYFINLEIDPSCIDPVITWTAYGGGEILPPGSGTSVEVNGKGYYSVEVECASGCDGGIIEYIYFDNGIFSKVADQNTMIKKDRTRYVDGLPYTPHEYEQLMLKKLKVPINSIQVSPNPFVGELNILGLQKTDNYDLTVLDMKGQMVFESELSSIATTQIELDNLSNGLYIINLFNNNTQESVSHIVLKLTNK